LRCNGHRTHEAEEDASDVAAKAVTNLNTHTLGPQQVQSHLEQLRRLGVVHNSRAGCGGGAGQRHVEPRVIKLPVMIYNLQRTLKKDVYVANLVAGGCGHHKWVDA
jgi:hypothetical protein